VLKCKFEEEEDIQGSFDFYSLPGFEEISPLLKKNSSNLSDEERVLATPVND
jgi:hypothetical protein